MKTRTRNSSPVGSPVANPSVVNSRTVATVRGLVIFGAVWQVLWLLGDPTLRSALTGNLRNPGIVLIFASMLLWVGVVVALFGPRRDLSVARALQVGAMALLGASGLTLLADSVAGADGWFVGASVANLAAGLAGISLSRRAGLSTVGLLVGLEAVIVYVVHASTQDAQPLLVDLVYPFYAAALGLACVGARFGLIRSARAQDASELELERQQQARATSEFTDASIGAAETRLHETVLNTLTAIERGGLGDDDATTSRLRERAAESAAVLRLISEGADATDAWTGDLRVDLAGAIVDLQNADVAVEMHGVLDLESFTGTVRPDAMAALGSAVREALINVHRHAQAGKVVIRGEVEPTPRGSVWRVSVSDDGRGVGRVGPGFGRQSIIGEGVEAVGGRSSIGDGKRRGTNVTVEVPLTGLASTRVKNSTTPVRAVGGPIVLAFTLFTVFSIVATWSFATDVLPNVTAALIFGSTAAVLIFVTWSGRYSMMPWWASLLTLIAIPVMTAVEAMAQAVANPTGDWTSEVGAAFIFVVVATGHVWVGPLAFVSWFIAQEAQWIELFQPGTVVIVVAMFMGWQLRRAQASIAAARDEAGLERTALAVLQERLANARRRYADVDTTGVIGVLEGVSRGDMDPRDPDVKEMCRREERMIRSVLRLHPERFLLHRDLVRLAAHARDRGLELSINVPEEVVGDRALDCMERAHALIDIAQRDSTARVSVTCVEDECSFRLVAQVPSEGWVQTQQIGEIVDDQEGIVSVEEFWSGSPSEVQHGRTPSVHGTPA